MNSIRFRCGSLKFFFLLGLVTFSFLSASPFGLNFPPKKNLKNEDWIALQDQLHTVQVDTYLRALYPQMKTLDSFFFRCQKGVSQILINPQENHYPYQKLIKIGKGGEICLVCCVPFNSIYPELVETLSQALAPYFNGYFLYQVGGFPNPTGEEILYSAVPYSFKIFMMLEAYQKGFDKVIWIDSSLLPLRDLQPLMDEFNQKKCLLLDGSKKLSKLPDLLLPIARDALQELTSFDPLEGNYVCTLLFGLHMNTPKARQLVELYYQCVKKGTPFLSYYPEEIVLTGIIGSLSHEEWPFTYFKTLVGVGGKKESNIQEKILERKNQGYYFYYRNH